MEAGNRVGRTRHPGIIRVSLVICLGMLLLAAGWAILRPVAIPFGYSGASCRANPIWLPELARVRHSESYTATPVMMVKVLGYTIYSHHTCLTLRQAAQTPADESLRVHVAGLSWLGKRLTVKPDRLPAIANLADLTGPVSTGEALTFQLDKPDRLFEYRLSADGRSTDCSMKTAGKTADVVCDVTVIRLAQASRYSFTLQRFYNNKPVDVVHQAELATVEAVTVTASSIAKDQMVYDKPGEMVVQLNRPAAKLSAVSLRVGAADKQQDLPITTELKNDKLTVRFTQPLPRDTALTLHVGRVTASDGGYLAEPYVLTFRTSGGPKVKAINIGSYRVASSPLIRLNFDSAVKANQQLADFVRLEANGKLIPATIAVAGSALSIAPRQALGTCVAFTVKVADGLVNTYDVGGGTRWQFQSRTICQTAFSIGTSVQGRAIEAFRFGSGSSRIVYVGGTHGNERSSVSMLQRWLDHLEANPSLVPAGRAVTIIPIVNPDGYAANRRTNDRNVDLNRNFPSNNWKQSVTMPDKTVNATGGGGAPLSEPESAALAAYVQSQNPRLVLTYHATGGVVIPNDSGDSAAQARAYADRSSVYFAANAATATLFEYDTTGAFEDWLRDKRATPALLIELTTMSGNEFNGHLSALRTSAGL